MALKMVDLPITRIGASPAAQALRKQLELSQLHLRLQWTDPVSGESGEGLTALLWHIKQIQSGDHSVPLCDVSEREYQKLVSESESWLRKDEAK